MVRLEINNTLTNCGIQEFYDNVAKLLGYMTTETLRYNCTKIKCSENIFNDIMGHYESQGVPNYESSMYWLCMGPKVNEDLKDYTVEVEDDFISVEV